MAMSVPFFAYGPPELATMEYIAERKFGITVGTQDQAVLQRNLKSFMADSDLRLRLGVQARKVAEEEHDGRVVRARFRAVLVSALATTSNQDKR